MSNRLQAHPLTDGTNLIPRTALLNAMEDEDDIEWKEYPFDRPHRAEPESPDESLAMIQFARTPALQEALRALCMEFNSYLHHSGTTTSRKSEVNGYRYRSIEVGAFKLQAFSRDTIPLT
jgi:hypothetical protein